MFSADLGGYTAPAPAANDPPFEKVALLLHGDGTNGAQNNTFVDYSYPGGYAVSFDGTGDFLTIPSNAAFSFGTGDFTVEWWQYWNGTQSSYGTLYTNNYATNPNLTIQTYINTNKYIVYMNGVSTTITESSAASAGQWYHYAVVRNGTTVTIYRNGTSTGSTTYSGNVGTTTATYIGSANSIGGFPITAGYISNFRVVKGTAIYTSSFIPSNQPLTAVSGTSLLTCQSATIVDNSPNAFTITANGDAAAVSSKTITRTGNVAQGTFSPFSLAEGQWSNYFSSTTSYLTTPATTAYDISNGNFTMEAWVNYTEVNNGGILGRHDSSGTGDWGWYYASASQKWRIIGNNGATIIQSSATWIPTVGTWYHIALCRSGNSFYFFINGTQLGTTQTNTITFTYTSSISTYVGSLSDGLYTRGYLSNVRFIKGTALYTSNFTPSTSPLTAVTNTQLLTCQSNRFIDNSSNNSTLTPQSTNPCRVTAFSPFAPSAAYSASTNGGSGYFDANNDYLTTSSSPNLALGTGDFTIECWIYNSGLSPIGNGVILDTRTTTETNAAIEIDISNPNRFVEVYINGAFRMQATQIVDNAWYHIALTRSGTDTRLFVNGVQSGSTYTDTINYTTQTYTVGGRYAAVSGDYRSFNGYISNLRVIKGTALYTTTFTPPTAPLTAVANTQLLLNCTNAGIIDNAGKNDIETVGNAQISTSVKKYGTGSMYFDGTDDSLVMPASTETVFGTGNFTIEGWINIPTAQNVQNLTLICKGTSASSSNWQLGVTSTRALTFFYNSTTSTSGSTVLNLNQWYHFAVVGTGTSIKVYLDGVQEISISYSYNYSENSVTKVCLNRGGTVYLNCYIDDLRITKGQALYTSNFTPPTQAFPNV